MDVAVDVEDFSMGESGNELLDVHRRMLNGGLGDDGVFEPVDSLEDFEGEVEEQCAPLGDPEGLEGTLGTAGTDDSSIKCSSIFPVPDFVRSSPLHLERFQVLLDGYDRDLALNVLEIIRHGVVIPSLIQDNRRHRQPYNHPSAVKHGDFVSAKLAGEVSSGRISGPFQVQPPGLYLSPLAVVPKQEVGKFRLIHDLSWPKRASINSNIPRDLCHVTYETLDDCVEILARLGPGALIAKTDIAEAFRILQVHPESQQFLGFYWDGFYWDRH